MRNTLLLLTALPLSLTVQSQINPVTLTFKGEIAATSPATPQKVVADQLGNTYFYLAAKAGGLQVFDIQDIASPMLAQTVPVAQFENLEVMYACQRGNLLYIALGNFFGNNGQNPGLAIVDVGTPANPVVKDVWVWDIQDKGSAFVTVSGDYAYLAAMSQGLLILNISNPDNIAFVSQYLPDPDFPMPNPSVSQVPNARGLAIKDEVAYLCYDAGGLRVINVSDKTNPIETGRYINTTTPFVPAGKQQAFNNIVLEGTTAYVAVDYCGMEVLDISDTANITQISWWNPWQCQNISNIWLGSPGHTNQIDLDTTNHLVFLSAAQSELSVVDVSDPGQPLLAGSYGVAGDNLGTWGMTLDGHRLFLVYIVAVIPFASNWAGVKILEWGKPSGVGETSVVVSNCLYPNPFQSKFFLEFELKESDDVKADIFDMQGKRQTEWFAEQFSAGKHLLKWEGKIPPGMYVLRLATSHSLPVWKIMRSE